MAGGVSQTNALGGIWPLGVITVTSGTAINVLVNVTPTGQVAGSIPTGRPYAPSATQIVFSTLKANTGEVYVNYGGGAAGPTGADTNATCLCLSPGQQASLPYSSFLPTATIDLKKFWIDGTQSGDKVAMFAADCSS